MTFYCTIKKEGGGCVSKTVLVCAAAGNRELILLFSYYNIYFRERKYNALPASTGFMQFSFYIIYALSY